MNVGELIAQLSTHNPDTPVSVVVWGEIPPTVVLDAVRVDRAVTPTGSFVQVHAE